MGDDLAVILLDGRTAKGLNLSSRTQMTHLFILIAALGQSASTDPDIPNASVHLSSSTARSANAMTEPQYRELVRCTLARNGGAVAAWIDTRFQLGRGQDADYRRKSGQAATLPDVFVGCYQLKTGSFPFSLDRLARDWADRLGITKEDPNTLEKQLERRGRMTVTSLQGYVACIRQKNPPEAIRAYLAADGAAKARALMDMTLDCDVASGASLTMDVADIDRALGKP